MNIDQHLLRAARQRATERGEPLGSVLEDALRMVLTRPAGGEKPVVNPPTFGGGGLQPGVDLEDQDALASLLGDDTSAGDAAR